MFTLKKTSGLTLSVRVLGHQKQVGPELFRVFYTIWKETEAEAQEVWMSFNSITTYLYSTSPSADKA